MSTIKLKIQEETTTDHIYQSTVKLSLVLLIIFRNENVLEISLTQANNYTRSREEDH
jgi:hypothetical protein